MSNENSNHHKMIIVGSGPAGYTAALYAGRAELKPLMFSGMQPGGQLMITTEVENFPGYPEGVNGPQMMDDLRIQAERFGMEIRYEQIDKVDLNSSPKQLWTGGGERFTADVVIVSTGASAMWLGLEAEEKFLNKGVSACAVCDGYFFRGQDVAIVGGGDTAAEEALYLSKICKSVQMLVRRDELRASRIMAARVKAAENITIHWNTNAVDISGEELVETVHVVNNKTGEKTDLKVGAFFVAIGHKPNTEIFAGQLDMDESGYIINVPDKTNTNIDGVFVCGDAADRVYRQAVTAAGTGCMAALDGERWLAAKEAEVTLQAG